MRPAWIKTLEAAILVCALAGTAAMLWPAAAGTAAGKERAVRRGAAAIKLALDTWTARHEGSYPETIEISGGNSRDALIEHNFILKYPANPFRPDGEPMKRVPFNAPSAGDFSYERDPEKTYKYRLIAYGEKGRVVFRSIRE